MITQESLNLNASRFRGKAGTRKVPAQNRAGKNAHRVTHVKKRVTSGPPLRFNKDCHFYLCGKLDKDSLQLVRFDRTNDQHYRRAISLDCIVIVKRKLSIAIINCFLLTVDLA